MIQIEIQGDPIPWARPRLTTRNGKQCGYDSQEKLKEGYKWQMLSQYREGPIAGPLALDLVFYMPIPKTTSGIKTRQMLAGLIFHIKRPDIDNLEKFVLDAANGVMFNDDSQIIEIKAKKLFSTKPATLIKITKLGTLEGYNAIS